MTLFVRDTRNEGVANRQVEELKKRSLAHHAAVKLSEGEILELTLLPDDGPEFFATHEDTPIQATHLQIEDVTGRRYPIKNSGKSLVTLLKAWNP